MTVPFHSLSEIDGTADWPSRGDALGFLEFASDAVFAIRQDGTVAFANRAAVESLGYSRDELLNMGVWEFDPLIGSSQDFTETIWPRVRARRRSVFEMEHVRKDGSVFPVEIAAHPIESEEGPLICSFVRDISERVAKRERASKLSETRRRKLSWLGLNQPVWEYLPDQDRWLISPGLLRLLNLKNSHPVTIAQDQNAPDRDAVASPVPTVAPEPSAATEQTEPSEWTADDWRNVLDDEDAEALVRASRSADEQNFSLVTCSRSDASSPRWFRHQCGVIEVTESSDRRVFALVGDETEVRAASKRRERLFAAAVDLHAVANLNDDSVTEWGERWASYLGYDPSAMAALGLKDVVANSDLTTLQSLLDQVRRSGRSREAVLRLIRQDGMVREVAVRCIGGDRGSDEFYVAGRDLSDSEQAVLSSIADTVPLTLYLFDLVEKKNVFVNRNVGEQLGYSPTQITAMGEQLLETLVHPEDLPKIRQHHRDLAEETGDQCLRLEYRMRHVDGSYRTLYSNDRVFKRDADGKPIQIVGTATLLDEIETLKRYAAQLETVNRDLEQFAYVASHDLKQPLRGIAHLAGWILEDAGDVLPKDSREHLDKLVSRVGRMQQLLSDLLDFSRAGRVPSQLETFSIRDLVQSVIELGDDECRVQVQMDGVDQTVTTHRVPLEQVLRNLIGNAVKHHDREDGHVWVRWTIADAAVTFVIDDDGPGIAPEFREKVFDIFRTLSAPGSSREGTGMGLAIARKLVETQGGRLQLSDRADAADATQAQRGCRFGFRWKIDAPDDAVDGPVAESGG